MLRIKDLTKDEKGSSSLEFAAMLLPIIILLTGILQFSMIPVTKIMVRQAAFEALRQAAKSSDPVNVALDKAYNQYPGLPNWRSGGSVEVTAQLTGIAPDQIISVNVRYKMPVISDVLVEGASGGYKWIESGVFSERIQEGDL